MAVFTSIFIGTDYTDGTIHNKLIVGHARTVVYLSNFIISTVAGCIIALVYILVTCIALLLITTLPLCNYKLNELLPVGIKNLYLLLAALYLIGFFIFYSCYCYLVYRMLKKNLLQV